MSALFQLGTYRNVVEVWQQEHHAEDSDQAEEDGTHRRLATCAGVDLAAAVASKGWNRHEQSSKHVGHTQSDQLSVRRHGDIRDSIWLLLFLAIWFDDFLRLGGTGAQRFGGHT